MHILEEKNAVQLDKLANVTDTIAELKVHNLRQYCHIEL